MKTKECIHCETFFDCAGKPSDKPCLQFKNKKDEQENGFKAILENEMKKVKNQ